jgi:tRNA/rRNA methyltransferase
VILLAYEWSRETALSQPTAKEMEPPASMAELEGLIGQLEVSLEEAGYFFPPDRVAATKTTLRTILTKPQWSTREIQALRGVIRALGANRSSKI